MAALPGLGRGGLLLRVVAEHGLLLACATLGAVVWIVVGTSLRIPRAGQDLLLVDTFRFLVSFIWIPVPFAFLFCRLQARSADGRLMGGRAGWAAGWRLFRERYANPDRIVGAAAAAIAIAVVMNTYVAWKRAIPAMQPFGWDARFADLDRTLHFGRHPWEWLQPVLDYPFSTWLIDRLYFGYFVCVVLTFAWQAWSSHRAVRRRFLVSVSLAWLLMGNWLATLFSSVGPCYFRYVAGPGDPYAGLFQRLSQISETHPLAAPWLQEHLWASYLTGMTAPYRGISAMPSMHVAITFLFVLTAFARSRWLGLVFGAYLAAIVVGSVLLGWHYAVDAYASLLGAWGIWRLSGWMVSHVKRPSEEIGAT